ncbi:hypothetical protein ACYOEI_08200 [Singulisphaera rosea]
MTRKPILATFVGALLFLGGCDPNPDGPSAPSAPSSAPAEPRPTEAEPRIKGKKRMKPLRQVAEPIGASACPLEEKLPSRIRAVE